MSATADYGRPAGPDEEARLGAVLAETFGFPPADAAGWFDYAGRENLRVLRDGGEVAGGLILIPMGQFWGGRPVRMCGVAGVGVAPHLRGGGRATGMIAAAVREMRAQGFALSALYPATQPLYRRAGYEQAGTRFRFRAGPRALAGGSRELPVRPFTPDDLPAAKALYQEVARTRDGWLDRGPYTWHRVRFPRGHTVHGYAFGAPGELDGYLLLSRTPAPDGHTDVLVTDLAAGTPAAWRRIWTFLGDHGSLTREVTWFGGADDPLLELLAEQDDVQVDAHLTYMIRVLDVAAALAARGYPKGVALSLHLEISDPLFTENTGRFVLEVSGGEGRVTRGGEGLLKADERALATLYSGFRSATALAGLGRIVAPAEALASADALFTGRPPSMREMF